MLLLGSVCDHLENNLINYVKDLGELLLPCIKILTAISLLYNLLKQKCGSLEESVAHYLFFCEEKLVILVNLCVEILGHESFDLIKGY
jgi:hypothetical protein